MQARGWSFLAGWGLICIYILGVGANEAAAQLIPGPAGVNVGSFRTTDKYILGGALGHGFATEPLQPKKFYLKAVPGFYQTRAGHDGSQGESQFDGVMFGGTLLYGFSEHWGVSFTAAYEHTTSGSARPLAVGGARPLLGGWSEGYIIGAAGVYDPFDGDNLRLPITLGISYNYYSTTVEGDFSGAGQGFHYKERISRDSPGIYAGVAPQWNWGDFRLVPFGVVSESGLFNQRGTGKYTLNNNSTGRIDTLEVRYHEATYFAVGMTVKYRPWNLGLSYVRADLLTNSLDTNLFTATWDRTW